MVRAILRIRWNAWAESASRVIVVRSSASFRIYDLRHTCITLWIKTGVRVHVASKLAGHATAAFTLTVYAKVLPEQKVEAAAKMDAPFGT